MIADEPRTLKEAVEGQLRAMPPDQAQTLLEEALPEREQRIILARLEGRTFRQIAEEWGVSPAAAGQIAQRAYRKIAVALRRERRKDDWFGYCQQEYEDYLRRLRAHADQRRREREAEAWAKEKRERALAQQHREEMRRRWPGQFPAPRPTKALPPECDFPTVEMCGTPAWFREALRRYDELLYAPFIPRALLYEMVGKLEVSPQRLVSYARNERERRRNELSFPHWRAFGFVPH